MRAVMLMVLLLALTLAVLLWGAARMGARQNRRDAVARHATITAQLDSVLAAQRCVLQQLQEVRQP